MRKNFKKALRNPEKLILDAVGAKAAARGSRNEPIDLIVPSTAHRRHHHHQVMMNVACECTIR